MNQHNTEWQYERPKYVGKGHPVHPDSAAEALHVPELRHRLDIITDPSIPPEKIEERKKYLFDSRERILARDTAVLRPDLLPQTLVYLAKKGAGFRHITTSVISHANMDLPALREIVANGLDDESASLVIRHPKVDVELLTRLSRRRGSWAVRAEAKSELRKRAGLPLPPLIKGDMYSLYEHMQTRKQ